jgi:hypothetical protein
MPGILAPPRLPIARGVTLTRPARCPGVAVTRGLATAARTVRLLVAVAALALLLAAIVAGVDRTDGPSSTTPREQVAVGEIGSSPVPCLERGYAAPSADGEVVALVRGPAGAVRAVSFEHGWRVYQGRRPGTLVAVCRDTSAR